MKKILCIYAIMASIFMMSCSKSFIELNPESSVSVDILYKTDKDYQDAIVGCYSVLRNQYNTFWQFGDLRGDDSWMNIYNKPSLTALDIFTLNSDDGLLKGAWQNYYKLIYNANMVLSKIEAADEAVITNKSRHIGEAKFLRALAYFDLVRIFGNVPKITSPVTIEDAYNISREDVNKIYDEIIIPDLLDAEGRLALKYTGTDLGRATQGAAKALLGKVYLTRKDFVNAETKLQEVTTMGYKLLDNYNDLFDYTKDEHHSEYIFDIEYEQALGGMGNSFTNAFMPNSAAMLSFYGIVGGFAESNSPTDGLFAAFTDDDKRKDVTVGVKGGFIDGSGNFVPLLVTTSQSYTKKYITPVSSANDSKANWKVIRYADVLLMYAEALNENGKTDEAVDNLNLVRHRAGVTEYSDLGKDDAREKIYLERRLELSFEGQRWFDLVRTGRAYETMQSVGMKPYMTVFPVPLSQIQLINDPSIFPQNEGY